MKVLKYIALVLAGLFLDFFCVLAGVFSLQIHIGIVSVPLIAVLFGFLHSCLCKIIRKDLSITTVWYTIVAQLLPIAAAASVLVVTVYKRNTIKRYDFKGLEQAYCTFSLVTLVMMMVVSFLFSRGMKNKSKRQIAGELGSKPDERQV